MTILEIDLYPRSRSPELDLAEFQSPSAIYRGTPFWSWNNKLDVAQLQRQIEYLRQMGFGGFHMHARSGLDTPYLGPDFLAAVQACVRYAQQAKMHAWRYDEDRWPSGFAGGLVTREPRFRARHLLFTPRPYEAGADAGEPQATLLARYDVVLRPDGLLESYRRLDGGAPARGTPWYAYVEIDGDHPWYNGQAYVDTLSRPAIEKFLAVTHERYYQAVGAFFGAQAPRETAGTWSCRGPMTCRRPSPPPTTSTSKTTCPSWSGTGPTGGRRWSATATATTWPSASPPPSPTPWVSGVAGTGSR